MIKFEIGKTYSTRSICDHNCIFSYTIKSRTDKTVTLTNGKRFKVAEMVKDTETEIMWKNIEEFIAELRRNEA